jgi:hypothetical protein
VLQMTVVPFGRYLDSWVGLLRINNNYKVKNVSSWFESFTGGEGLSLICLFRRCCISNEVGGELLSQVRLFVL